MRQEPQSLSPIVKCWDEISSDMKNFLENPYSWISGELKKIPSRLRLGPPADGYDTLMKILDLLNSVYFPSENHSH